MPDKTDQTDKFDPNHDGSDHSAGNRHFTRKLHMLIQDRFILIVIIFFLLYTTIWSYMVIERFYSLNAYVYDLGVSMQRGWELYHQTFPLYSYFQVFSISAIVYLVSPLTLLADYPLLLIFQTVFLALASFPIYGISKHHLKNRGISLIVVSVYLMYFPLAGVNWYGFHYQALFITLFLCGYYYFLKGRYKLSVIFMVLSGTTGFPYMVFPWIFSLQMGIESLYFKSLRKEKYNSGVLKFSIILLSLSTIFLLIGLLASGSFSSLNGNINNDNTLGFSFRLDEKIITMVYLLAPFLFIPLLSRRWIIMMLPFTYLILSSNYIGYSYPHIFQLQYSSGIIPFLVLGFIEGLSVLTRDNIHVHLPKIKVNKKALRLAVTALILTALFASVYQPYGPLNSKSVDNFSLNQVISSNTSTYMDLVKMVSLIPNDSGNILYQDNLPELLPRPLSSTQSLYPSSVMSTTITMQNVTEDQFPIVAPNRVVSVGIQYAIADLKNPYYYLGNDSMSSLLHLMYSSGYYGIISEAGGLVLLERNYSGPMMYYQSFSETFSAVSFINATSGEYGINTVSASGFHNELAWHGPWTYIFPGRYSINFLMKTSETYGSNSMLLEVTTNSGVIVLNSTIIYGTNFTSAGSWHDFHFDFTSTSFYGDMEFLGFVYNWQGTVFMKDVGITQTKG